MMYAEISSAIASVKTAIDIAKAAKGLSNYNELVSALSEVNAKLMSATGVALASQEKQASLVDEVSTLKRKLMDFEGWETKSKDYVLQAVGVREQHFAQIYKPPMHSLQARHWACAKCFQERKVYILSAHGMHNYKCPNCEAEIGPIVQGGMLAPIASAY
jgi:hypothetical protein